ncbi:hypothetical protein [Marinospirillum alkaliphilum]|uniref:Lipoprotein n=1 Tax=Marinospirillum alkaliphilum DSM 21637 TaxID=1122209 RepID=A0A1K1YWY3_9GAMM|nr:hypothetical protein [Marinospirillum alkaliphilum]SFX66384.1 hypothetical protein SAMN02745752_02439 [Marinospirillum alkaliphilum DSM 21637]
MKMVFVAVLVVLLSACSSSPYKYYVEPTPIKKQSTLYKISDVNLSLTLGSGVIPEDDSFSSEAELKEQFSGYLDSSLENKGIAGREGTDYLEVVISIDYKRIFNHGGRALNKPQVSHEVTVFSEGKKLASFSKGPYTTRYGYFEDAAVNMKIATFSWGREDELRDVEMISRLIIDDLANMGL